MKSIIQRFRQGGFIVVFLLAAVYCPLSTSLFGQEIIDSIPIHPRYTYNPTKAMWSFQQDNAATGHQVDFLAKNGVPQCWADANGQLACQGGFGTAETLQVDGTPIGTRPTFNFITGSNITLLGVDDPGNNRVNLTITSAGGGGTLETMQVDGTTIGTRPIFNFITGSNTALLGADDAGNNRVNLTVTSAAGANPKFQRWSYVVASGPSTGVTVTSLGDVPYGVIGTAFNASATSPPYIESTATGPGNPQAFLFGRYVYFPGKNVYVNWKLRLESLIVERSYVVLNQSSVNAYVTDVVTENMAGFRYSTVAGDINFKCISADGVTEAVSDSGVAADLNWHLFELYDQGATWDYFIDNVNVCTHAANLPSGVPLKPYISTQSLDFDNKGWDVAWWYGEVDY